MPDEYGATPNYGLRFPNGNAPIDTAGDIKRLAEDVDGAIGLKGPGRPDGRGGEAEYDAPIGTVFTCTQPDTQGATGNYGAIQWVKDFYRGWVVTVGQTKQYQIGANPNWDNNGSPTAGQLRWTVSRDATGIMMYARGYQSFQSATTIASSAFLDDTLETWFGSTSIGADAWGTPFSNQIWHVVTTSTTSTIIGQVRLQIGNPSRPSGYGSGSFVVQVNGTAPPSNDQRLHMHVAVQGGWPYGDGVGQAYTSSMYISELKSQIAVAAEENPELADQLKAELEALRSNDG